jgi:uncharacterized protein (TIGR01244 family)
MSGKRHQRTLNGKRSGLNRAIINRNRKAMEIRPIADGFSVTGQISAGDVKTIAEAGYKTLISNRPDSEDGAVPHDDIERAAAAAGLKFVYIPVVYGAITPENVREMSAALDEAETPVLAYCRSGGRCTNLFGLVKQMKG